MSTAVARHVTVDEFIQIDASAPEGTHLELIDGEILERTMSTRSPRHAFAVNRIGQALSNWLDDRPSIDGAVYVGDVRCCLRHNPDSLVGIDVGFWSGASFATPPYDPPYLDAPPVIAVEVLSPSDTHEAVTDKTRLYLACGVSQVWVADPDFCTVTIFRQSAPPTFYHAEEFLKAEPELPGFAVRVGLLFSGQVRGPE
jgi:Uma2 family endonuclease